MAYSRHEGANVIPRICLLLTGCLVLAAGFGCATGDEPEVSTDAGIRAEVEAMSDDFVNLRMLTGFVHEMPLAEAYRWQDEMIEILGPAMGEVVGYKTGGHDPNPPNASFPPGGIRAHLLSGMFRADPSIRVEETSAGFLEADFAFRVGDVSINTAETDLEILAGLDAVVPFAEIPDPYYDPETASVNRMIVSNMISRWAFSGEPVPIEPTEEWLSRLRSFEFAVYWTKTTRSSRPAAWRSGMTRSPPFAGSATSSAIQERNLLPAISSPWATSASCARSTRDRLGARHTRATSSGSSTTGSGKTDRRR